jgi:hypothetical protein
MINLTEDLPAIRYGTWAGKFTTKIHANEIPFLEVHKLPVAPKQSEDFTSAKPIRSDLSNGLAVAQRQDSMVSHVTNERGDLIANTIDVVNDPSGTVLDGTNWIGKATGNNQNLPNSLTIGLNLVRGTQPVMGISSQKPSASDLALYRQDSASTYSSSSSVAGPVQTIPAKAGIPIVSDIFPKMGIGLLLLIIVAWYFLKGGA